MAYLTPEQSAWLAAMSAAQRGGEKLKDNIVRGLAWATAIEFSADYSGDAFACSLGYEPDNGASETNDVTVTVGSFTGGKTLVTLSLNGTQTGALAADGDGDGLVPILFDLYRTPSGESKYLILAGYTLITGSVGNV